MKNRDLYKLRLLIHYTGASVGIYRTDKNIGLLGYVSFVRAGEWKVNQHYHKYAYPIPKYIIEEAKELLTMVTSREVTFIDGQMVQVA